MTTKYKHKHTGDIAEKIPNTETMRWYNSAGSVIPAKYIEGCGDWKPVQDSLYEIIAYQDDAIKGENGRYCIQSSGEYKRNISTVLVSKETLQSSKSAHIHSIKILSTQEVLTVGDKIVTVYTTDATKPRTVDSIKIDEQVSGGLGFYTKDGSVTSVTIVKKYTEPVVILITEDMVEIVNPDQIVYKVNPANNWSTSEPKAKNVQKTPIECTMKVYNTSEARQEYIIRYKPLFSIEDIMKLDRQNVRGQLSDGKEAVVLYSSLGEIAKTRIKQ